MAQKISFFGFVTHRITLNVIFWIGYFVYPFLRFRYTGDHTITYQEVLFYLFFYGSILYFNNLYLLPKYLESRKFKQYALIIIPILIAAAFIESYVNKTLLKTCSCEGPRATYAMYNFIHLGSIMVIFGAVHIFRTLNAKVRAYEKSEKERLETELKFLKSQVNPHMLFNSLNSIYAYALENSKRVPDMVIKLSEILRYMLYECDKSRVLLEKELTYLKDYVDLQKMRLEDLNVSFTTSGAMSGLQIAPMILIAYVENAFKYAGETVGDRAYVKIEVQAKEGELHFHCENSYNEDRPQQLVPSENGGLGVKNAKSLLDLTYPEGYSLHMKEDKGIFNVDLTIDLNR